MEMNISILFVINLCIILCKYGNCIENRTACFTIYNGVCIKLTNNCPFNGGIDMKNQKTKHDPLCAQDRHCCVPPENKDRFNYTAYKLPQCGTPPKQGRIYNGFPVNGREYPWHVAIYNIDKGVINCGGSFIDPSFILTAAHCFSNTNLEDWLILPSSTLNIIDGNYNPYRYYRIKKIISKTFSFWSFTNDIALLELTEPVPLDSYVNVICLPNDNETFENMVCTSSGWGKTETEDQPKKYLQIAVPILSLKPCQDMLKWWMPTVVNEKNICGGYEGGVYQNCPGDSGGPLVCRKKDANGIERYIIAGLISFGQKCGLNSSHFVYTNVAQYLPWIRSSISARTAGVQLTTEAATISCNSILFIYSILNFVHFVLFY